MFLYSYFLGIYKKEWEATECYGISSKCYICVNNDKIVKLSARGVPWVQAKQLTVSQFHDVLLNHNPIVVDIEGFNYVCGRMLAEKQAKCAITCMYVKRRVRNTLSTDTLEI